MLTSCYMPKQIIPQKMPHQIPQNMLQRLWQTTPSQTNNQFISYGPTQQLAWQQQLNIVMYNQQQMSGQIDNQMNQNTNKSTVRMVLM
ncbi:hypothetical protein F8M41_012577 [Gigaspora margarita]|uniref:Uncharacterized protein n=1 Tax=Gigaspora margarita TaxID=4874 RepID=A0A8H4ASY0_GIGMA|nr:hypothetical protein F8M41_012577 [Gigaspora margarita]